MTLHVNLPDSLASQARARAEREHITVDAILARVPDVSPAAGDEG